jgi:CRISPR-associated protein Cas6
MIATTPALQIDLAFSVSSTSTLFADHSYALYGAISRLLPNVHSPNGIGIHPIRGDFVGERRIQLTPRSRLIVRTPTDRIADWLPLAGKRLDVAGASLLVGVPQVHSLVAAPTLRSRLVCIKLAGDDRGPPEPEPFLAAVRRKLDGLGVSATVEITLGKRRPLHIKHAAIIGYEVLLEGLSADESLTIQTSDTWSRRHMGCGIFVPLVPRSEA